MIEENEEKYSRNKLKFIFILIIITFIFFILGILFYFGIFSHKFIKDNNSSVQLENPINKIIFKNQDSRDFVKRELIIEQALFEFNEEYINYLLIALKVKNLHKSTIGYGNPIIQLSIDEEYWVTEINGDEIITNKGISKEKDLIIYITKRRAIEALLSLSIEESIKGLAINGEIKMELISGKVELGSKGYLKMYTELTGKDLF